MRAILWIFALALVAFCIHLASFALIPPTRGPSVRVSHAVLGIAEKVLGEDYLTEYNPQGEYPRGSLHANSPGQKILVVFWSLVYLFIFSVVYFVFARMRRSRVPHESFNRR
ncbi:MAG TPA: hypothetical protein VNP98_00290 [Chthoniobacterales bacterium]|nr:hypothetical protein [Chthoniobacterales bacterium]